MSGLILTIDVGTSSSRAMLYEADSATALPGALFSDKHQPDETPDGGSTLDPDALVEEVVECAAKALAMLDGRPLVGVGVTTFWHSALGIGADGRARTPVLLWSDRRSAPQVAKLREDLDPTTYSHRTGCPLHVSYLPGRLRWLAESDPATFDACTRFVSPGEYLFGRLFGPARVTCATSMASATGLYDQEKGVWDEETLSHIPGLTPERLSAVGDAPVSGIAAEFRDRLGAAADVPWFPALGDGACSNVGCGAVTPDTMALMVGTSGALRVAVPDGEGPPPLPSGLWRYLIGPGRFLLGGALSNGGSVWAWLREMVRLPDVSDDELERQLAALPADGHGLTVLPFLSGERAPLWRDDLRATIHGLSGATTPLEVSRAHLEAVALRFAALRGALGAVSPPGKARILGTGAGLLASRTWAQIIADALGEPLLLSSEEQASSRGVALVVREALGLGSLEDAPAVPVTETIMPDAARHALYNRALERQERLRRQLWA